ncbi:AAA family ATPase [Sinanaerobacter sp. ZZT-01]|uniref:ParA family protein n=1 Tax=Sinanaerobacter sp. ZZT-01 TaxID=3111540 RepID=UPI002D78CB0E|nr:AAA family ATPase [Sinanaerobacter sp. ZZT-01]WRR93563.1 AAA family ATPase [Sinanaerobacter sp. ZZT-01]
MSHIIAITNQKGGVGKTTTSSALVSGLTQLKKKVLGVDLDPQGNLGFSLGVDIEGGPGIYELFKGTISIQDAITHTPHGDIIPSNILLSSAELEFNRAGREYMLRDLLAPIQDQYDFIIIDTPPALNILTVNAYVASNALMIPMIPEVLSLLGITQLKETIDTVKKFYNPNLEILGILLTKYNKRMNLTKEVEELTSEIAKQLGTVILSTKIRNSVTVAEAPAHGESIITYAPYSNPGFDYARLAKQLCEGSL